MATVANRRIDKLGNVLKIVYERNMTESIKKEVFFLATLMSDKVTGKGKQYTFATHLRRNTAVSARGADDYLEAGLPEVVEQGSVTPKYVHIPFEITYDLMKAAKTDPATFADGMETVQRSSRESLRREMNRMAVGDGKGTVCTIAVQTTGGAATETITVDSTKYLEEGMLLDAWNAAHTATLNAAGAGAVPALDAAGYTQTRFFRVRTILTETTFVAEYDTGENLPSGANVMLVGSVFCRKKNTGFLVSPFYNEPNGLRLLGDDGTIDPAGGLHGVDATLYGRWRGIRKDGTGLTVSPAIVSAMGIQFRRWSATFFDTIWAHDNQIHGLLYGEDGSYKDKRYVDGKATDIGDSYEDVVVNVSNKKIRLKADLDLPEDTLNFFDRKVLGYAELWPVQLLEQADGQYLTPWRDSTGQRLAQVGFYGWSGNFFTRMRNGIGSVYGLNKPASIPAW